LYEQRVADLRRSNKDAKVPAPKIIVLWHKDNKNFPWIAKECRDNGAQLPEDVSAALK
jgi:hypothetical protein